jgi:hypothetical protein
LALLEIRPVRKRFWWPHPYARAAGLLWIKRVVRFGYFVDGVETDINGR